MSASLGRRWAVVGAASFGATALAWFSSAAGFAPPPLLSRGLVLWTVGCISLAAGSRFLAAIRSGDPIRRNGAWALFAVTLAALAARFVGLGYELTSHFHNDEGTFLATARSIQDGNLLPVRFHYPHLLYYLSAFALWTLSLFEAVVAPLAGWAYGATGDDVPVLVLRGVAASLGALTVIPVFCAARRLGGLWGAVLGGALIAVSPTYNEVSHLAISDVPAGFFAALVVYFAARLLDGESLRDYLFAGVAAGLAAASKYPAGLSALAIVGVWAYWRWHRRDWNAMLLWSGLGSIATLLTVMPALWLRYESVFGGPSDHDILFGFRQYALEGWIGVVVESNAGFYALEIVHGFGWPAVGLGCVGLFVLSAERRGKALALLPYPIVLLGVLLAMNIVVKRNLQPLLPVVAVILGIGLSAWPVLFGRRFAGRPRASRAAALGLGALVLLQPLVRTVTWDLSRSRPGTARLAVDWIEANVPQGAAFLKEAYTPDLHPRLFLTQQTRYAARLTLEEIRDPRWDYLLLARNAHLRFLTPEKWTKPHHEVFAHRYDQMFDFDLVRRFEPGIFRAGPDLLLYRVDPAEPVFLDSRRFTPADVAYYSHPELEPRRPGGGVHFSRSGQSVIFKEYLDAGQLRVSVHPRTSGVDGWLYVISRSNLEIGQFELEPGLVVELPRRDKYFLRIFLGAGDELRGLVLNRPSGEVLNRPSGEVLNRPRGE